MKAIVLKGFGGVENLIVGQIDVPAITDDEVLIKVKAFSINPVDYKVREGVGWAHDLLKYNPIILGWDVSGIVEAVGKNVAKFKAGDEVFGMINFVGHGKAYAEYVAAKAGQLALKPKNISHAEAAASTLAALTAWQAFHHFGRLKKDDKVLIHAASGGVGHFAVQIAKYMGAYVIGTSSAGNKDFVLGLGADRHIDYRSENFDEVLSDIDFCLETIGHVNFRRSVQVLKRGGTIVNLPSGLTTEDERLANIKDLKSCFFMAVYSSGRDMGIISDLLGKGLIKPFISRTFVFDEIREAHRQIESGRTVGKVVVCL
ncbi:NADP-dependent oxidoreductase [Sinomicrobium weinanense]|uniref:NADP-dependent oxidoreductase n=1 Tax=Sinomicrobium weinanense TaxID=2842200 RepID=A0A926JS15_9FLAO|nr:NADP-dependent oxidoreductase [Sinomicrobium weinanense]MBC9796455.1 NADP-dependent oxidoreductase [Sinomicrobium weinanense]MBU3125948.1 NADP-dependent oxidoreductase [Sinomicrobium weinanense]